MIGSFYQLTSPYFGIISVSKPKSTKFVFFRSIDFNNLLNFDMTRYFMFAYLITSWPNVFEDCSCFYFQKRSRWLFLSRISSTTILFFDTPNLHWRLIGVVVSNSAISAFILYHFYRVKWDYQRLHTMVVIIDYHICRAKIKLKSIIKF